MALFSLVVPCYRVAEYLPAFLRSLERQGEILAQTEVIFVVDGCPAGSEQVLAEWSLSTSIDHQIHAIENRGVSGARNYGLARARGEWVSFPDPDDEFYSGYLRSVARFLAEHQELDLIATQLVALEPDGRTPKWHQLGYRFTSGNRVFSLQEDPEFVQLAVHTAFFRRARLAAESITFDERLRIAFEDGNFVSQYLLTFPDPRIGVCVDARYGYKSRADGSSLLAQAGNDYYARYRPVLEYAHLALVSKVKPAPRWLENVVLYDLYWLFAETLRLRSTIHGLTDAQNEELHSLSRQVLNRISPEAITDFRIIKVRSEVRSAWLVARLGAVPSRVVRRLRTDLVGESTEYRFYTSERHAEFTASVNGNEVQPTVDKTRTIRMFGKSWLYQRVVWLPSGMGTVFRQKEGIASEEDFFGGGVPVTPAEFRRICEPGGLGKRDEWLPGEPGSWTRARFRSRKLVAASQSVLTRTVSQIWHLLGGNRFVGRQFRDAWVLMDRDTQANDNAEALYRVLQRERPDINSWFVLRKDSPDYPRLQKAGFRLVPFGSWRHFRLLKKTKHLISSQIDQYVVRPFAHRALGKQWNYVFLQHGVVHNSLHRWLNVKNVQLLISSTEAEWDAFVRDGGEYIYTTKDVVLTGMPRHDTLTRKMAALGPGEKNLVTIMPTWRQYLMDETGRTGNARRVVAGFSETRFIREWSAFLRDPRLAALAEKHGVEFVLLPHPNLSPHAKELFVPKTFRVASYQDDDVQDILAKSVAVVTDYSSQAFEGAYCLAPSVYFQFDRDTFFSGAHIASPGYFSVETDGFGPVAETVHGAISALDNLLGKDTRNQKYTERMETLYPFRDGLSSVRIIREIEARLEGH